MQARLKYISFLIFPLLATGMMLHAQYGKKTVPLTWTSNGISISLKDNLKHPAFSWPLSLLKYRIDFGTNGIVPAELELLNKGSGKSTPFQLTDATIKDNRIQKATLVFLSDLPSGGEKTFDLLPSKNKPSSRKDTSVVQVERTTDAYLVSNGKIRLEIPLSGDKLLAPVKRYGNDRLWLGYGEMPAGLSLLNMSVTELSTGPVEAAYLINYAFAGNKRYTVKVKLAAAMEFAEIEEQMTGFGQEQALAWRMVWNGIAADHRYACTRGEQIDKKATGFNNYAWEPMEGLPTNAAADKHPLLDIDQRNDKNGKLPFRIAPYDNWMTWWRFTAAAFWSEKDNTTIGLFIKDMEQWNDSLYALWGSKENLNISFHWKNNVLDYSFPLSNGTRSTALAAYPHQKDVELVNKNNTPLIYIDYLRHWQGWITLDKVKDWILAYDTPETGYPRYFKPENITPLTTLSALENSLSNNLKVIAGGTERMNGPTPVGSRVYHDFIVPAFDLHGSEMNADQYARLRAWFLFVSYLYMDESLMPVRTMLSGHPNFLSDIKAVPGLAAFLFPKHPEADKMADHYEKAVHLNFNYHIRPEVPSWEARGGRWTENLATYTWAALTPVIRTNYLLHHHFDHKNRILQPGVSMYGNWLLNAVTPPLTFQENRRVYPPQGAHARAYKAGPPSALRLLGQDLQYYNPILSENLFWITTAEDIPFESTKEKSKTWGEMLKGEFEKNRGTNPHLRSAKYTGYGFILRSGFGTKDEMYVNLQQIDEGPNYRWGRAAMGGNGVIYYYAGGKRYSHNGSEDVGDGPFGDVERICNFGVKKAGGYRSIGPYRSVGTGDLTEPLYDFGFAQLASIKANKDIADDYHSRSVLQSAADYIAIFDEVKDNGISGRFSWFVGTEDEFPSIYQVLPGAAGRDADIKPSQSNYHKDPEVLPTKGRYYDGNGNFLTIVTHKAGIQAIKSPFGCTVQKPDGTTDLIFRDSKQISYMVDGIGFKGTAGIVQKTGKGMYAAALFNGTMIEVPGIKIELTGDQEAAIGLQTSATGFSGNFQCRYTEQLVFSTTVNGLVFYLDGIAVKSGSSQSLSVRITIPPGKHSWQWTKNGVIPAPTVITGAAAGNRQVVLNWKAVPGAAAYRLQVSKNGGESWADLQDNITAVTTTVKELVNGTKIHVRIISTGPGGNSEPSDEYPVYVTDQPPHCPEGLMPDLNGAQVKLSWGTVPGAGYYQLYRRVKTGTGETSFLKIYTGIEPAFKDHKPAAGIIYEYAVSAVNGNGESKYSTMVNTDPASFLNWEPKGGEGFRRDTEDHQNGFSEFDPFIEDQKPVLTYPISKRP